ncbi:Peptidylprolyl isomerase [Bertholletia excelsa]
MDDAIDLTGDGGVIKSIIKHAKPDAMSPTENLPLIDVHYERNLPETGEVFDTTGEGWDVALRTMKIAKYTIKPEYAYGSAGSLPDILPDASSVSDEMARLEELKRQREMAAATKEEEKEKGEEAKAAAAARILTKLEAKKGQGKGKGKAK